MVLRETVLWRFWGCSSYPDCDGLVGVHPGTTMPLGTPANAATRRARLRAHEVFDRLWKTGAAGDRTKTYAWLADQLGIRRERCHIGNFDAVTCARVVEVCMTEAIRRRQVGRW